MGFRENQRGVSKTPNDLGAVPGRPPRQHPGGAGGMDCRGKHRNTSSAANRPIAAVRASAKRLRGNKDLEEAPQYPQPGSKAGHHANKIMRDRIMQSTGQCKTGRRSAETTVRGFISSTCLRDRESNAATPSGAPYPIFITIPVPAGTGIVIFIVCQPVFHAIGWCKQAQGSVVHMGFIRHDWVLFTDLNRTTRPRNRFSENDDSQGRETSR